MRTIQHFLARIMVLIIGASFIFSVHSCEFDDSEIWDSINDLDQRVKELEQISKTMQSDLESIQTIVEKLQQNITVDSIVSGDDSYTIKFSDGTSVTIVNNIKDIIPPAVVLIEEDGCYWWGYRYGDGHTEFLTDGDGRRIPASEEVPQVRINPETNMWEISTDGGMTWEDTGVNAAGNGESLIDNISEDEDWFYIQLSDGGIIKIAKTKELAFAFNCEEVLKFKMGETQSVGYTLSGAERTTISKPDGWKVRFVEDRIEITAPVEENTFAEREGKIAVIAFGSNGQSVMAEISVAAKAVEVRLQIQWTQGDRFFTDLHFGTADETGAEELNPSNCFLVRPGKTYRFRSNIMGRGADGVSAMGLNEDVNRLGDFTILKNGAIHDVLNQADYEYIYFTTCAEGTAALGGNGVFSVMIDGKVAWTWHVWARDEDPELEPVGAYEQMSVNLGSWGPEDIEVMILNDYVTFPCTYWYGLPYSWGFNVPYPGLTSFDMAMRLSKVTLSTLYFVYHYDENNQPYEVSERTGSSSRELMNSVENPLFLADLTSDGADIYSEMWGGSSNEKTIFDPCPYGYKVSGGDLFDNYNFGLPGHGGISYVKGRRKFNRLNFGGILSLDPETNIPSYSEEKFTGYYWVNTAAMESGKGDIFWIQSKTDKGVKPFERMDGALIRCIKYDKEQ